MVMSWSLCTDGVQDFGVCFFGIGIPATIFGGLWGFAIAMVAVNGIRWLTAIVLGWYKAIREERTPAKTDVEITD